MTLIIVGGAVTVALLAICGVGRLLRREDGTDGHAFAHAMPLPEIHHEAPVRRALPPPGRPSPASPAVTPSPLVAAGHSSLTSPCAPALVVLAIIIAPLELHAEAMAVFPPWQPWPGDGTLTGMRAITGGP